MKNREQILTKQQYHVLITLIICILGVFASSCQRAINKGNKVSFGDQVIVTQKNTRFAQLSNKATLGHPITVVKDNTSFAPLLSSDPPLEELIDYILNWQNSLTSMAIMKIEFMDTKFSCSQINKRCQTYVLKRGTEVSPVLNSAGEILRPSRISSSMLVKADEEYGIMGVQNFLRNGGHVKYHLMIPRLGAPVQVNSGTDFANIEPQKWPEIEPYVWWSPYQKKSHGSLERLIYQAKQTDGDCRVRAVLDPVRSLIKPSDDTILVYNADTGNFGVMWLRDFQSARPTVESAAMPEVNPAHILGDPIPADGSDCRYISMTSDLLPLVLIGMKGDDFLTNRELEVCPFKEGESVQPVLTENNELFKPSGHFTNLVLVKLSNGQFGLIYKDDYDLVVNTYLKRKEADRREKERQELLAKKKKQAAAALKKQREEEAAIRDLCSDLYLRTADKKIAELTVREEQQIKDCQWYGFYKSP